jgi:putative thioredoxin
MDFELQDFQKDVIEKSRVKPVVIDFWAPWCGPCRQLGPTIEKLASEPGVAWSLVKINTDKHPDLAVQFQIRGIPAVKMVYNGSVVAEFTGAQPEATIRKWLEQHLPTDFIPAGEEWMEEVELAISGGDRATALAILDEQSSLDDTNKRLQAMLCLPSHLERALNIFNSISNPLPFELEKEALDTVQHLFQIANGTITPEKGNAAVADVVDKNYRMGIEKLFEEEFEQSMLHFLEVLQRDRSFDQDGGRKACLALFQLLGEAHPLTHQYRRAFSMSLY